MLVITVANALDVIRYIHVSRAGRHAHAALDTAISFLFRLFYIITLDDFIKAFNAFVGGKHFHLDTLGWVKVIGFFAPVTQFIVLPVLFIDAGNKHEISRLA